MHSNRLQLPFPIILVIFYINFLGWLLFLQLFQQKHIYIEGPTELEKMSLMLIQKIWTWLTLLLNKDCKVNSFNVLDGSHMFTLVILSISFLFLNFIWMINLFFKQKSCLSLFLLASLLKKGTTKATRKVNSNIILLTHFSPFTTKCITLSLYEY